jgi:hypothetical protein
LLHIPEEFESGRLDYLPRKPFDFAGRRASFVEIKPFRPLHNGSNGVVLCQRFFSALVVTA